MSDQDFFFEDEERPTEPARASAKPASGSPAKAATAAPGALATVQTVSVTVAALAAVCALLVGVIIGILIPRSGGVASSRTTLPPATTAPQLSPEELGSGELPAGHPDIGGMGGTAAPATGGATGGATTRTP